MRYPYELAILDVVIVEGLNIIDVMIGCVNLDTGHIDVDALCLSLN